MTQVWREGPARVSAKVPGFGTSSVPHSPHAIGSLAPRSGSFQIELQYLHETSFFLDQEGGGGADRGCPRSAKLKMLC